MHYYEVAPNHIIRSGSATFTYHSSTPLLVGQCVQIEVGKKIFTGVIIRQVTQPSYATKTIYSVIEDSSLPYPLVKLALWLSDYYATPLAIVLQTLLPRGLQKKRRARIAQAHTAIRSRTKKVFTPEQSSAINYINTISRGTVLLHGVTGSGKTSVYIEAAKHALFAGKSVVVLVPEIALTSQMIDDFSHHFSDIILTHSRQTEAERHTIWRDILHSTLPRLVIGPRSALFLPLKAIGLIVIDEAHEPSFKQEQSPRYSALRAASMLARYHKAKVVLGTATPTISDYYLAQKSPHPIIRLPRPARQGTVRPDIHLVDMTKKPHFKKHRFLSDTLLSNIELSLAANNQVLIFHNRRGSASTTLCHNCGWAALCPRCFVPFTLHADLHQLRCHICGLIEKVPTSCPICHSTDILHKGIGTKSIETELQKLFPKQIIARFDGDTAQQGSLEKRYEELYKGKIDIIVGTQVIAKGLDLPNLRLVGIVQADAGLSLPDFGASERTFQLLAQAIGRVGRSHHSTTVIVQTYHPTHPAVVDGIAQNYEHFYQQTLKERQLSHFPPFTYLLKLTCTYKTETAAITNAQKLASRLRAVVPATIQLLGPTPAFYERQHDTYRWQLLLKSQKRSDLVAVLRYLPPAHWQFELDPASLL